MFAVRVDEKDVMRHLRALERRQWPFALALAINRAAKEGQSATRAALPQRFSIAAGREKFLERLVRIGREDWARKDRLQATIRINERDTGTGKDRSQILGRHQAGGVRTATDPMRPFFIPTQAIRAGDRDLPPRSLYPTSLGLFERRGVTGLTPIKSRLSKRGKVIFEGKRGTFLLHPSFQSGITERQWGIYRRLSSRRGDIELIWAMRRRITLPPRLRFYETVQSTVNARFDQLVADAVARAVRTSR